MKYRLLGTNKLSSCETKIEFNIGFSASTS